MGTLTVLSIGVDGTVSVFDTVTEAGRPSATLDGASIVLNGLSNGLQYLIVGGEGDLGFTAFEIGSDNDVLVGTDAGDILTGYAGDDTLSGLEGDDTIVAHPGDDVAHGGGGADWIRGSSGNDRLSGGPGDDSV